ncbi:hypothetical protein SUGI_0971670 [Cryptomeria japonica]|nr:hypothetical protein SUGI_0971670 [Cryptomeria japonica]
MAVPSETSGQPKYGLRNAFDGLRIALPASVASTQAVHHTITAFDGLIIAPPAESKLSSEMKHPPYDVFINHHGGDVKYTVANSIYKKLDATGLRVFLDKNELELGDIFPFVLQEAMQSASIHISIFSAN